MHVLSLLSTRSFKKTVAENFYLNNLKKSERFKNYILFSIFELNSLPEIFT